MDVTQQRDNARLVEFEGALFALRPGAKIVALLFIPADRRPENVVLYVVAVLELHGRALLNHQHVRRKDQAFLVHQGLGGWRWKCLAGDRVNIDDGFAGSHLAFDGGGDGGGCD